jgi:hypothetical protein
VACATHAKICSERAAHFENVGKQALERSGKYRVNENDEVIFAGRRNFFGGASWPGIAIRRTASLPLAYAGHPRPMCTQENVDARNESGHDTILN